MVDTQIHDVEDCLNLLLLKVSALEAIVVEAGLISKEDLAKNLAAMQSKQDQMISEAKDELFKKHYAEIKERDKDFHFPEEVVKEAFHILNSEGEQAADNHLMEYANSCIEGAVAYFACYEQVTAPMRNLTLQELARVRERYRIEGFDAAVALAKKINGF